MTQPLVSRLARAAGRNATFLIVPARDVTASVPGCYLCTWVASGHGRFYLKYCSASCHVHAKIARVATT